MNKQEIYNRDHRISNEQEAFDDINALLSDPSDEHIRMAAHILFSARKNFDEPVEKLLSLGIDDTIKEKIVFKIRSYEVNDKYAYDFVKANINLWNDPFYCCNDDNVKKQVLGIIFKPNFKDEHIRSEVIKHLSSLEYHEFENLNGGNHNYIKGNTNTIFNGELKDQNKITDLTKYMLKNESFTMVIFFAEMENNNFLGLKKDSYERSFINYVIDNFEENYLHEAVRLVINKFIFCLKTMEDLGVREFKTDDPIITYLKDCVINEGKYLNDESEQFLEKLELRNNLEYF